MKKLLLLALALVLVTPALPAAPADSRIFEMRTYYAAPGKLAALNARFRDHTLKLFEKHGITNLGYWEPLENKDQKLIYVLAYPDRAARDSSWKAFMADPAWKKAHAESERDGKLVARVERVFLIATDYSPAIKPSASSKDRVFNLRTYVTPEGKLDALHARFRDHTVKLFEKHGMFNLAYWVPAKGEKGAANTLIYILAHDTVDAAKASFDGFRQDPAWTKARTESEKDGKLTTSVVGEYMKATDYSPSK